MFEHPSVLLCLVWNTLNSKLNVSISVSSTMPEYTCIKVWILYLFIFGTNLIIISVVFKSDKQMNCQNYIHVCISWSILEQSSVVLYCWSQSDSASVRLYFTFCHTCSLCRVELVVKFPARSSTQVLLCLFLMCCGCDSSCIVSVHIQCQASYIHFLRVAGIYGGCF